MKPIEAWHLNLYNISCQSSEGPPYFLKCHTLLAWTTHRNGGAINSMITVNLRLPISVNDQFLYGRPMTGDFASWSFAPPSAAHRSKAGGTWRDHLSGGRQVGVPAHTHPHACPHMGSDQWSPTRPLIKQAEVCWSLCGTGRTFWLPAWLAGSFFASPSLFAGGMNNFGWVFKFGHFMQAGQVRGGGVG